MTTQRHSNAPRPVPADTPPPPRPRSAEWVQLTPQIPKPGPARTNDGIDG